jgi:chaperonin GroEL (HSP60 family)
MAVEVEGDTLKDRLRRLLSFIYASKPNMDAKFLIELLLDACMPLPSAVDLKRIVIVSAHGAHVQQSQLVPGVLLNVTPTGASLEAVTRVQSVIRVICLSSGIERLRTTAKLSAKLTTPEEVQSWKAQEHLAFRQQALAVTRLDCHVVVCGGKIHPVVLQHLTSSNIVCFQHVPRKHLMAVAGATGAALRNVVDDLSAADVGHCDAVSTLDCNSHSYSVFHSSRFTTLLLRGLSPETVQESERLCHYGLKFMRSCTDSKVAIVQGGGYCELELAARLLHRARADNKLAPHYECFAEALVSVPRALYENASLPGQQLVQQRLDEYLLRLAAAADDPTLRIVDQPLCRTYDSFGVKHAVIEMASSLAADILSSMSFFSVAVCIYRMCRSPTDTCHLTTIPLFL